MSQIQNIYPMHNITKYLFSIWHRLPGGLHNHDDIKDVSENLVSQNIFNFSRHLKLWRVQQFLNIVKI